MKFKLSAPPSLEVHAENIVFLFVRDANGAGVAGARIKVWAGPPPTGQPPYFVDDVPFRTTSSSGKLEYTAMNGAMPDSRDYWMQVIDTAGAALSDPVQFHFPKGSTLWITAILEGTEPSSPGGNVSVNLDWDPRLNAQLVTLEAATAAAGQPYWKLIRAKFLPEGNGPEDAQGRVNIYYTVLNENGQPIVGQRVWFAWPGDRASKLTGDGGTTDFNMTTDSTSDPAAGRPGPHSGYVDGLPSDKVNGMGLPLHRHVCYELTWRKTIQGTPPVAANSSITGVISNALPGTQVALVSDTLNKTATPDGTGAYGFTQLPAGTYSISITNAGVVKSGIALDGTNTARVDFAFPTQSLEGAILSRAQQFRWMPINDQAALYRFAQQNNLGYPQTDEFDATFNGEAYIGQVYNLGIVYVKKGDWGNIKWMKKP